jgi:hypothetical protein
MAGAMRPPSYYENRNTRQYGREKVPVDSLSYKVSAPIAHSNLTNFALYGNFAYNINILQDGYMP